MKLLLDSHTFLWFVSGDSQLSDQGRSLIENPAHEKLVSIASLWEIAIKCSVGKLILTRPFEDLIPEQLRINGFEVLGIHVAHVTRLSLLPLHHRDPFDRIIVAQCLVEDMDVVSVDDALDAYGIRRLW